MEVPNPDEMTLLGRVVVAVSILLGLIAAGLGIDRRYVTRAEAMQIQMACKDEWERIRLEIERAREERQELSRRILEIDEKMRDRDEIYHRENQAHLSRLGSSVEDLGKDLANLAGRLNLEVTRNHGKA